MVFLTVPKLEDVVRIGPRFAYLKDGSKVPKNFTEPDMQKLVGWQWSADIPRLNDRWRLKLKVQKMIK